MARCEHCPLGIAIDALNDYADDFEDDAVINPNSQGNNLQVRAQTYKKLFERVACNVNCQYSPYAKEAGMSFNIGDSDESEEAAFVEPNADSIVLDLINLANNPPDASDEVSEADTNADEDESDSEVEADQDESEDIDGQDKSEYEVIIDNDFLDLDHPEDISGTLDQDQDEDEDEDEPELATISMDQFLADLQNRDINPRTIQACIEPFQLAIQLAAAAQSQFGPRYVDPAGYLQSEQSRKAGKKVQKKVDFGFHQKS